MKIFEVVTPTLLHHTTLAYSASEILEQGCLRPKNYDSFVSLSVGEYVHDITGHHVTLIFKPAGFGDQLMEVEYSEDWAAAHPEQAGYIAGEGWAEQYQDPEDLFEPPDDLDPEEAEFWEPDEDDVEDARHAAEVEAFLCKSGEEEWISREAGQPVTFRPEAVIGLIVRNGADLQEWRRDLDALGYPHVTLRSAA
jgi:hypothetical protein